MANELFQAPIGAPMEESGAIEPTSMTSGSLPGSAPTQTAAVPVNAGGVAPDASNALTLAQTREAPNALAQSPGAAPVAQTRDASNTSALNSGAAPVARARDAQNASVPQPNAALTPTGSVGAPTTPSAESPFHQPVRFDSVLGATPSLEGPLPASIPLMPASEPPVPAPSTPPVTPEAITPTFSNAYELSPTGHGYQHASPTLFDPHALRREFPILHQTVNGKRLVWLDNAATTQKPQAVIDRLKRYYEHENSNIHRAAHTLAARATDAYEGARETVRRFINAPSTRDLIFVRGATEGINLIAKSWGARNVNEGDEIVISWLEHHANIVPWQQLCAEKGAKLKVAPVDSTGQIILEEYEKLLGPKTRLVAFTQVSNALGTVTPAKEMIELAHRYGAKVLLDGAQAVSHLRVDVQQLDCDFFVFSGHKVFAPTGIGVVFARSELMDATPPWQGGGNMIQDVTFERTVFHPSPARFEAGTGNIADAVGLGAALDWLSRVGLETVARYEHDLLEYATEKVKHVRGLTLYGTAPGKAGVLSFTLAGQKTEQVGALLDKEGIAVRSGHHCAQPILRRFGVEATVRASLAPYNTCEDIDALVAALHRLQER
ncbi:MAG: SufS family cysteine desulfurase [Archangium sp.]|nr:SufS family cysteine desulfurase [Archangium sp.]